MDAKSLIYSRAFASWGVPCCGGEAASLFYALAYVAFWGMIVWMLFRKRIFIGL